MRTTLTSLALGLLAVACSTGKPMDMNSDTNPPANPASMNLQEATFAAG